MQRGQSANDRPNPAFPHLLPLEEKRKLYEAEMAELKQHDPPFWDSYIYVIEGAGLRKIGLSRAPKQRLADLQSGSPVKLVLERTRCVRHAFVYPTERHAHSILKPYRSHGEWFKCTKEQAKHALNEAAKLNAKLLKERSEARQPLVNALFRKYFPKELEEAIARYSAEEKAERLKRAQLKASA